MLRPKGPKKLPDQSGQDQHRPRYLSCPLGQAEEGVWDQVWCEWTELIDALPEPYRKVFRARALEDRGYRDIGGAFGKSESWARVTFYRAKQKLMEGEDR